MRIGTLFSGIGSPEQGASRVYNDLEMVFACEWDKYARESFNANYTIDQKHFHKDIADMDGKQYQDQVDILIGGSPCQDFSLAGLRKGIDGHKGILIYEYIRIIEEVRPPIFIYENVKGMLSDKGGRTIKDFVEAFRQMGYHCHYEVINTKDYGVPQNRERIFLVGFKCHEHYYNFSFAPKIKLQKRLKDILESEVDEKYYLSEKNIKFILNRPKNYENKINPDVSNCLRTNYGHAYANESYIKEDMSKLGDIEEPKIIQKGRGYNKGGVKKICPTLTINSWQENNHLIDKQLIRKLTPKECFRLQDFPDTFKQVVSNSQAYKQAGNSISVNVMEMIFNQIELTRNGSMDKGSLF